MCARAVNAGGCALMARPRAPSSTPRRRMCPVEPRKIHTVVASTQHVEPSKVVRAKECAGYSGQEMIVPSTEDMNKEISEKVVERTLSEIKLKSGATVLTLYNRQVHHWWTPGRRWLHRP